MNAFGADFSIIQLALGFALAALVALGAYALRSLSLSGAVAAALLGTAIFGLGGWPWAALLLGFFISSSLLSHLFKQRKVHAAEKFSKDDRRDAAQVLANGGLAGLMVLLQAFFPHSAWPWAAAAAALAAANADTWATELGVLSQKAPRLITSGKKVEMGTSGGVTALGTLAAFSGALLIGLIAGWTWPGYAGGLSGSFLGRLALISLAGLAGSLVNSLLGATFQAMYTCPACQKETEKHPLHSCGTPTVLAHGLPWLDNDWVNTACTVSAAVLSVGLVLALPGVLGIGSIPPAASLSLTSGAFAMGTPIPAEYTCAGQNVSPALSWSQAPAGTQSYALLLEDPDAPVGTFTHWVLYNLPAGVTSLPRSVPTGAQVPDLGSQGKNSFGNNGYGGPCPPQGSSHRYFFTVYALDLSPDLPAGLSAAGLRRAINGHVLAQGAWMGTFTR